MTEQLVWVFPCDARVDRLRRSDVGQLVERLVDEYQRDEAGKALLGEARYVAHQETQLERHNHQQSNHHPEPDPETKRYERQVVSPATTTQHCISATTTMRQRQQI